MVVFNLNSKRLRRPNVRLWEIGDLSAAFACQISQRSKETLGQKRWINEPYVAQESEYLQISGEEHPEYTFSDYGVSPRGLEDIQHTRENKDPYSFKTVSEFASSGGINVCKSKLDFGTITRKSRLMNRRRRSPNSTCSLFGGPWKSENGLGTNSEYEKSYGQDKLVDPASDTGSDTYHVNVFKDSSEYESSMIKEAYEVEMGDPDFSTKMLQKPNQFLAMADSSEENTGFPQSTCGGNKVVSRDADVNNVREWLEELGFGKFAELFEMHEVDEETLPLLTFEDLKEMGIQAVGPRRKLFIAIQQLKGSV